MQIANHLTVEELTERYRGETDGRTRTHWQILWQMAAGKATQEVAAFTGLTVARIRALVRRYNEQGPEAVGEQRHQNPGAVPVLTPQQEAELVTALEGPGPTGEIGSGPQVAQWISDHAQRPVTKQCGWLYLQRLDYRLRVTRPRHTKADPEEQAAFKKLPHIVRLVHAAHPGVPVELWAFDEHRIGLKPVLRRVWARRGSQPVAVVHQRYEWFYLYGFVQPQTGAMSWWLLPTVRTDVFSQVLAAFAREVGAGPTKQVVLVLNNAGWHTSAELQVPARGSISCSCRPIPRIATCRAFVAPHQYAIAQSHLCLPRRPHRRSA